MNDWGKYETSMKEISEQPVKVNNTSLVKKRVSYIVSHYSWDSPDGCYTLHKYTLILIK